VCLVFHKLHITENTVGVPNNLISKNVFKRYAQLKYAARYVFATALAIRGVAETMKKKRLKRNPILVKMERFLLDLEVTTQVPRQDSDK